MQAPARAREAPAPHGPGPRALRAAAVCYDAGRVRIHPAPAPLRLPTSFGVAVALVLLWWVMAVSSVGQKSTTFDELAHLTAGYSYWLTGDFRLQPENGNLPQRWAALPLLLGHYRFPSLEQEAWRAPAGSGQREPLSMATELHGLCLRPPQQPLRGGTSARRTERSRRPTTAA